MMKAMTPGNPLYAQAYFIPVLVIILFVSLVCLPQCTELVTVCVLTVFTGSEGPDVECSFAFTGLEIFF